MENVVDNLDLYNRHEAEQERWLKKRPVCADCNQHIQDEKFYLINDEAICPDCMECYAHWTDDYIE